MNALKPLVYFSIFKFPLTAKEIFWFSLEKNETKIQKELRQLQNLGVVRFHKGFYALNTPKKLAKRREKGSDYASEAFDVAHNQAAFISKIPFVKAVGLTGSLSKNYFDKYSAIEFFIIAQNKRLWIVRSLLLVYRYFLAADQKKIFRIANLITEKDLEISEKNIYTATELLTMIPFYGDFKAFYDANSWASFFLPNIKPHSPPITAKVSRPFLSRFVSKLLDNSVGTALNKLLFALNRKYCQVSSKAALRTLKLSKHSLQKQQQEVIQGINEKYHEFQIRFDLKLEEEHAY